MTEQEAAKSICRKESSFTGNVCGDHVAGAGLFDEDQGVTGRAAHRHLGASWVQQPFPTIQSREIILQDCIARNISSNKNLKCIFLKKTNFQYGFEIRESLVLFVFTHWTAQHWHHTASLLLGVFQNAFVYVACLPIWQEAAENKSRYWQNHSQPSWAKLCLWKLHTPKLGKQNLALCAIMFHVKFLFKDSCILRHQFQVFAWILPFVNRFFWVLFHMQFIMYEDPLELAIRMLGRFIYFFFKG